MNRPLGIWFGAILLFLAGVYGGCQSNPFQRQSAAPVMEEGGAGDIGMEGAEASPVEGPGLKLASEQRFSDVPLPVGLKEVPDRSYVFESSTLRIGRMVYTSSETVNDLTQFFIRECPSAGWELHNVLQSEGAMLEFSKSGKRLWVRIRKSDIWLKREIVIDLVPDKTQ